MMLWGHGINVAIWVGVWDYKIQPPSPRLPRLNSKPRPRSTHSTQRRHHLKKNTDSRRRSCPDSAAAVAPTTAAAAIARPTLTSPAEDNAAPGFPEKRRARATRESRPGTVAGPRFACVEASDRDFDFGTGL